MVKPSAIKVTINDTVITVLQKTVVFIFHVDKLPFPTEPIEVIHLQKGNIKCMKHTYLNVDYDRLGSIMLHIEFTKHYLLILGRKVFKGFYQM